MLSFNASNLTPELTGRADNAIMNKLSIKAALFALQLNELLCGPACTNSRQDFRFFHYVLHAQYQSGHSIFRLYEFEPQLV